MTPAFAIEPSWRWGTPEGSREFDRLLDRSLTFREKLEWLEDIETLTLRMQENRQGVTNIPKEIIYAGQEQPD